MLLVDVVIHYLHWAHNEGLVLTLVYLVYMYVLGIFECCSGLKAAKQFRHAVNISNNYRYLFLPKLIAFTVHEH